MARILIIDDEKQMRDITSQILKIEGHKIDTAADAENAIFKIKNNIYDILLVDLVLPGPMNGLDIIKQSRHSLKNIKIIAYSGFSGIDIAEKVIRAGADQFITKPFKRQELVELVAEFAEKKLNRETIIR